MKINKTKNNNEHKNFDLLLEGWMLYIANNLIGGLLKERLHARAQMKRQLTKAFKYVNDFNSTGWLS